MEYQEKLKYVTTAKNLRGWENTIFYNKTCLETVKILLTDEKGSTKGIIDSCIEGFKKTGLSEIEFYVDDQEIIDAILAENMDELNLRCMLEHHWDYDRTYDDVMEYMLNCEVADGNFDDIDDLVDFCKMVHTIQEDN